MNFNMWAMYEKYKERELKMCDYDNAWKLFTKCKSQSYILNNNKDKSRFLLQ